MQRVEAKLARKAASENLDGDEDEGEDEEIFGGVNGGSVEGNESGEEGWRNSEGERLKDFGVDEDVEFYDEQGDDLPLSQLLARKKERAAAAQ